MEGLEQMVSFLQNNQQAIKGTAYVLSQLAAGWLIIRAFDRHIASVLAAAAWYPEKRKYFRDLTFLDYLRMEHQESILHYHGIEPRRMYLHYRRNGIRPE